MQLHQEQMLKQYANAIWDANALLLGCTCNCLVPDFRGRRRFIVIVQPERGSTLWADFLDRRLRVGLLTAPLVLDFLSASQHHRPGTATLIGVVPVIAP